MEEDISTENAGASDQHIVPKNVQRKIIERIVYPLRERNVTPSNDSTADETAQAVPQHTSTNTSSGTCDAGSDEQVGPEPAQVDTCPQLVLQQNTASSIEDHAIHDRRKRRKVTRMLREPSEEPDPMQTLIDSLCSHLGIPLNRSFNEALSTRKKEEAGQRLKSLIEVVSDGALVPMMHFTLGSEEVKKLVQVKKLQSSILAEEIGLGGERAFHALSQGEQEEAGNHFRQLVKRVAGNAIVPLLSFALNQDDVRKLCSLKGMKCSNQDSDNHSNDSEEPVDNHEEPDVDERMALAEADIPHWIKGQNEGSEKIDRQHANATNSPREGKKAMTPVSSRNQKCLLMRLSDDLAALVGKNTATTSQVLRMVLSYISEHKLRDPGDKRLVLCDEKMMKVFGVKKLRYYLST